MLGGISRLQDVFKELLPLATHWKTIGALLGLPVHILDKIRVDEDSIRDCLWAVLTEWLKQVDPHPTWNALADTVECIDQVKAEEIRRRYYDVEHTL